MKKSNRAVAIESAIMATIFVSWCTYHVTRIAAKTAWGTTKLSVKLVNKVIN
jgi:hypothetical protein